MKIINLIFILLLASLSAKSQKYNDQRSLLDDQRINPVFSKTVKLFLDSAKKAGFKPVIYLAFRTFSEAEEMAKKGKKDGFKAAAISVHSFGLAVDIRLANDKGDVFSYDGKEYGSNKANRFSFDKWLKFTKIGQSFGLINAHEHNDSDHWELHPKWDKKDWVNAKDVILPIYKKYPNLDEIEKLKIIWKDAGL